MAQTIARTLGLRCLILGLFCHGPPDAQGRDVCPDITDVFKALVLAPRLSGIAPAKRVIPAFRPDGVLLLVVHHDLVAAIVVEHCRPSFLTDYRLAAADDLLFQ
jgi:hypothetical protein